MNSSPAVRSDTPATARPSHTNRPAPAGPRLRVVRSGRNQQRSQHHARDEIVLQPSPLETARHPQPGSRTPITAPATVLQQCRTYRPHAARRDRDRPPRWPRPSCWLTNRCRHDRVRHRRRPRRPRRPAAKWTVAIAISLAAGVLLIVGFRLPAGTAQLVLFSVATGAVTAMDANLTPPCGPSAAIELSSSAGSAAPRQLIAVRTTSIGWHVSGSFA